MDRKDANILVVEDAAEPSGCQYLLKNAGYMSQYQAGWAAGLFMLARQGALSARQVLVSTVAITLFMPCIAQWLITVKERGLRSSMVLTAAVGAIALGVAGAVNAGLGACPWILGR